MGASVDQPTSRKACSMPKRSIALRDTRDHLGTRHLVAALSADGTLTIRGHDLGQGVEQTLGDGIREYEWAWTIRAEHIALLRSALGAGDDLLAALAARFSNQAAAGLKPFLDEHGIPHESWSRIGE